MHPSHWGNMYSVCLSFLRGVVAEKLRTFVFLVNPPSAYITKRMQILELNRCQLHLAALAPMVRALHQKKACIVE